MSRFPKLSETFVLYEIVELEQLGVRVEIFPLIREREPVVHPEVHALIARTHYSRLLSPALIGAQLYWLRRRPRAYLDAWWRGIWHNRRSPKFLLRALIVVPKAALFARDMQRLDVGHIHAHWATHPALAAYVVHHLTGIPFSFTAHSTDIYVDQTMLAEKVAAASFVVAISDFGRRILARLSPTAAEKLTIIHCGVDLSVFQPLPQSPAGQPFTIVCVARLLEVKGHPYLLRACALLKTAGIQFRCLLIGDGPDSDRLEAQISELGLADAVVLLGPQTREQVRDIVARANVVVLTSITTQRGQKEGIPVSLMEAMALERPVVASAIGGIPELIEDGRTGLLVPERDADAIAQAIRRIHDDPDFARRLGIQGRNKVEAEFDLHRNAATLYDLLTRDWRHEPTSQARLLAEPMSSKSWS